MVKHALLEWGGGARSVTAVHEPGTSRHRATVQVTSARSTWTQSNTIEPWVRLKTVPAESLRRGHPTALGYTVQQFVSYYHNK